MRIIGSIFPFILGCCFFSANAQETNLPSIEILALDVISYEKFSEHDPETLQVLKRALHQKGIVGIKSIPGYKEKAMRFIEKAREFAALPGEVKENYAPKRELGELFLGYEVGKEQFLRPDGTWVVDDAKASYYSTVPDSEANKWPIECDLQTAYLEIAELMLGTSIEVMKKIDLIDVFIPAEKVNSGMGRMLHYSKQSDATMDNPFWCGAHFDHGLFTALLPGYYFLNGNRVEEPIEAGLFVRKSSAENFKKIVASDPDVMLFQVGEFGQLASNDAITATEHRVQKAYGEIERFTMAFFVSAAMDTVIRSQSILNKDSRYGNHSEGECTYQEWHEATFNRYSVKTK